MADDAPAESLQVSAELEAEFEQALQYHLTDEDLERARSSSASTPPAAPRVVLGRHPRRHPQLGAGRG